jgi:transposase
MKIDTTSTPRLSGEAFDALPEPIRNYIRFLEATIEQLQGRVRDLESRLAKNSSNSGKPPSSDGLKRQTKSQREKSDKKPGGQPGHAGKGLAQVENPNVIVTHVPTNCHGCGSSLTDVNGLCAEKRQVFDIPQPQVEVTEHRVEQKRCPCCGLTNRATFPDEVRGPVQYGSRIQALVAYFSHQHFVPMDRVCQIFRDIFDVDLSHGTCSNVDELLFQKLESFEVDLKKYLLASGCLHFDETGMRCEKKLYWVHVASSQAATFYGMHAKRGQEAMDEMGILPHFNGVAIHDHWHPYFAYEKATHSLCNAHHLRELTFIHEQEKEQWAKRMKDLLLQARKEVERHMDQGLLPVDIILQIESAYTQIITEGLAYHSCLPPLTKRKRGRQKQRDGKNFLDRLMEKRSCVLRFMYDFAVPFTNNQGEQDIRMVKLKQKIAGCFRALKGGQIFCRIRSYISTARKQGWNVWEALAAAIKGSARSLVIDSDIPEQVAVI